MSFDSACYSKFALKNWQENWVLGLGEGEKRHVVPYREPSIVFDQPLLLLCYSIALIVPMDTEQTRRRLPNIPFRVLIIGRANAGKTTILQRVCETTESPVIYRGKGTEREEVRGLKYSSTVLVSLPTRLNLTRQLMLVAMVLSFSCFELTTEPARRARNRR